MQVCRYLIAMVLGISCSCGGGQTPSGLATANLANSEDSDPVLMLGERISDEASASPDTVETSELAVAEQTGIFVRQPRATVLVGADEFRQLIALAPPTSVHSEWPELYSEQRELRRVVPCDRCINDVSVPLGVGKVSVACDEQAMVGVTQDVITKRLEASQFRIMDAGWDDGVLKAVRMSKGIVFRGLFERTTLYFAVAHGNVDVKAFRLHLMYELRTSPRQNDKPSSWDDGTDEQVAADYIGAFVASIKQEVVDKCHAFCERRIAINKGS